MDFIQIQSFVAAAELKNLTRASERMNLSLSALSTRIKSLEDELQISLFERNARGVELTPEGSQLLEYAINVVDSVEGMKRQAVRMQKEMKGSLTIGINTDPVFLKVTEINTAMIRSLPDVSLRFAISESGKTPQMLRNREIDLGFVYRMSTDSDIMFVELMRVNLCIAVSKGLVNDPCATSWDNLAALQWIWGSSDCPFNSVLNKEAEGYVESKKRVIVSDEYIMMELVKNGGGMCVLREDNARRLEEQGYVDILEDKTVPASIGITLLKWRKDEPLIANALKAICGVFGVDNG